VNEPLERLLADLPSPQTPLLAQLEWIDKTATAVASADLGVAGAQAALELRAALGAIVAFAQGRKGDAELAVLTATVRELTQRALATVCRALAAAYEELAAFGEGADAARARRLAPVWRDFAQALAERRAPDATLLERLR
jgi:hypothetical protein